MGLNLNKVFLAGNLTADPALRQTMSGMMVTEFTVAVNREKEGTDFVRCVAFGKTAETISAFFKKGRTIYVEGSLQSAKWTTKTGENRTDWSVSVNTFKFTDNYTESQKSNEKPNTTYIAPQSPVQIPTSGATYVKNMSDDNAIPPEQEWDDALPF